MATSVRLHGDEEGVEVDVVVSLPLAPPSSSSSPSSFHANDHADDGSRDSENPYDEPRALPTSSSTTTSVDRISVIAREGRGSDAFDGIATATVLVGSSSNDGVIPMSPSSSLAIDENDDCDAPTKRKDDDDVGVTSSMTTNVLGGEVKSNTREVANGVRKRRANVPSPSASASSSSSFSPSTSTSPPRYYTTRPRSSDVLISRKLTLSQRMREMRHSHGIMTAMSFAVLLTILLSSLVTMMLYAFPQFLLGLILGPIVRNKFWLVEFLYRHDIARWGHLRIFDVVLRRNDGGGKANSGGGVDATPRGGDGDGGGDDDDENDENASSRRRGDENGSRTKKRGGGGSGAIAGGGATDGHSRTLETRIVVMPDRVFIHPIPNFIDNIVYLIVCTPSREHRTVLPIVAVLVDCGESDRIMRHVDAIYERHYARDYPPPRRRDSGGGGETSRGCGIELYGILCTHHHHDHTAGVGRLRSELISRRMKSGRVAGEGGEGGWGGVASVTAGCGGGNFNDGAHANSGNSRRDVRPSSDVYASSLGNVVVVGGAAENVPHCNLFVPNGCHVPLPCVSAAIDDGRRRVSNDMNALVSIEVIGTPGHTRGSVVYALRDRPAPGVVDVSAGASSSSASSPSQSHLFTGDVIFCGGCGVPFEADLQYRQDDHVGNPMALRRKHGSSALRPGAGSMSMERCFVEVLTRAGGTMTGGGGRGGDEMPSTPPTPTSFWASLQSSWTLPSEATASTAVSSRPTTLMYPGHEYTTDLLMRQFDVKKIDSEIHWSKLSPSTFFEVASHYLVSAHRRGLPHDQRMLTIPTPLEREIKVNPSFRMLRRRGERLADALRLWYEFGAKSLIPDCDGVVANDTNVMQSAVSKEQQHSYATVFTTVYTSDLQNVASKLRRGELNASSAADQLESMHTKLDEMMIGRRPIPSTLPSHKNVYLGIVAMAMLGSAPSAMTVSDAIIMNLAPPADSADKVLINKSRLIAALGGLGILSNKDYSSPRLEDIIHLLWREAQLDYHELKLDIEHPNGRDVECSISYEDNIELGLLKLALFGVAFKQPRTKMCLPCFGAGPKYDETSWVKGQLRRTNGELVRHDAKNCLACV